MTRSPAAMSAQVWGRFGGEAVCDTLAAVVEPVFDTENSVVVAMAVELPIIKSAVFVSPFCAWTESRANGVLEPTPTLSERVLSVVAPNALVHYKEEDNDAFRR